MAAQWPLLHGRLLVLLPTLDGWTAVKVIDGPPVDDNTTGLYCTVGHVEVPGHVIGSGSYSTQRDASGGRIIETGDVRCELVSEDQRNDLPSARAKVFPLIDALDQAVRADYRLGVLSPQATTTLTYEVIQTQGVAPVVHVVLTLTYSTIT